MFWLLEDSRAFEDEYDLGEHLGSGSYAHVWECTNRTTGEQLACKIINKATIGSFEERLDLRHEIEVLSALRGQHPGAVQLREVLESEDAVHIIAELCYGGDLFTHLVQNGPLPEASAREVFRQVVAAVAVCHKMGVVHRDIKPENILFQHPLRTGLAPSGGGPPNLRLPPALRVKLADFGFATRLRPGEKLKGFAGNWCYTAPEVLEARGYDVMADVWSLGVLLCVMLTGTLPFQDAGGTEFPRSTQGRSGGGGGGFSGVRRVYLDSEAWGGVSREAKDAVNRMLQEKPHRRSSAAKLLVHPWLARG